MNIDQCFHGRNNVLPVHSSLHLNDKCLPRELIGHGETLQNPAIAGLIEQAAQRQHVIRVIRHMPLTEC